MFLLLLIPIVNIIYFIKVSLDLAKKFGKSTAFAVLLILFPVVGYIILGFDKSTYQA